MSQTGGDAKLAASVHSEALEAAGFEFSGGSGCAGSSLQDLLKPAAARDKQQGRQAEFVDNGEARSPDSCRACSERKVKGSPFCLSHKRGFQCIHNRCCKKNKEGNFVDPEAAENFHKIFGQGRDPPPNITLANQVVIDFVRENPEGKDVGKKRGSVMLARYTDKVYANMSTGRVEDDFLWDEELFVNKFKALRGWSQSYAQQKFRELKQDPNVYKDDGGFQGAMRVAVPPSWTGSDKRRKTRELGQEKCLERSLKSGKFSAADSEKILDELDAGAGFKMLNTTSLLNPSHAWNSPMPWSALTNMEGASGQAGAVFLVQSAAKQGTPTKGKGPGGEESDEGGPLSSPAKTDPAAKAKSEKEKEKDSGKFDLLRLKTTRTAETAVRDAFKKMEEVLKKSWQAYESSDNVMDEDLRSLMSERAQILMHCMGSAVEHSDKNAAGLDLADINVLA